MSDAATPCVRILHLSDLHVDSAHRAEAIVKRFDAALSQLVQVWTSKDAESIASLTRESLLEWFGLYCNHAAHGGMPRLRSLPAAVVTHSQVLRGMDSMLLQHVGANSDARNSIKRELETLTTSDRVTHVAAGANDELDRSFTAGEIERLRYILQQFASERSPVDILLVTGDLLERKHPPLDMSEYRSRLDIAFSTIESIAAVLRIPRTEYSRIVVLPGNHDWHHIWKDEEAGTRDGGYYPTLQPFIERLNYFYSESCAPIAPRDEYFYRIVRCDNAPVGCLPQPARLALVAFQGEPPPKPVTGSDTKLPTSQLKTKFDVNARDSGAAGFPDSKLKLLDATLRRELPGAARGALTLLSVSHRPLIAKVPNDPAEEDDHPVARGNNLLPFLRDCNIAYHIAGHEHDGGDRRDANPCQLVTQSADVSFSLYEFANAYPDTPRLYHSKLYAFTDKMERRDTHYTPSATDYRRLEKEDCEYAGYKLKCYEWSSYELRGALSRFHSTSCCKHTEQARALHSYATTLGYPAIPHACPYPDVYTRYFRWVFDTAMEDHDSPSDDLVVVHVGPFASWLNEPMNLDYYLQQLKGVAKNRSRLWRFFVVPHAGYTLTDYGFGAAKRQKLKRRQLAKLIIEKAAKLGVKLAEQDVIDMTLAPHVCPEDNEGALPLRNYRSFVITETFLRSLAGEATPNDFADKWHGSVGLKQQIAGELHRFMERDQDQEVGSAAAILLDALRAGNGKNGHAAPRHDRLWELWLGQVYRGQGDLREYLTFSYSDISRSNARVVLANVADRAPAHTPTVLAVTTLARTLLNMNAAPLPNALANLIEVKSADAFESVVDKEMS